MRNDWSPSAPCYFTMPLVILCLLSLAMVKKVLLGENVLNSRKLQGVWDVTDGFTVTCVWSSCDTSVPDGERYNFIANTC